MSLESCLGEGSTFRLHLPFIEPPMQRLREIADRRAKKSGASVKIERKGAILVAEDTASIQFLLRKILTPHATPSPDPVSAIVYAAQSRDVRHVFVDGRQLVEDGALTERSGLDRAEVVHRAKVEAARVRSKL